MTRAVVALAIRTGIPPSVWADEGEQVIATAFDLLRKASETAGPGGHQMSG